MKLHYIIFYRVKEYGNPTFSHFYCNEGKIHEIVKQVEEKGFRIQSVKFENIMWGDFKSDDGVTSPSPSQ